MNVYLIFQINIFLVWLFIFLKIWQCCQDVIWYYSFPNSDIYIYYANLIIIWFSFVIWYWTVTTALYITVIPQFLLNVNWIYCWEYCFNVKNTERILTRQMEYRVNTHNVLYHMSNIMYFGSDMPNIIYNIWLKI